MPTLTVSHFEFCVLFAGLSSVVLGIVTERSNRARIRYGVRSFLYFMVAVFGLGWLMYLGHG